jgi:hypothetical protein
MYRQKIISGKNFGLATLKGTDRLIDFGGVVLEDLEGVGGEVHLAHGVDDGTVVQRLHQRVVFEHLTIKTIDRHEKPNQVP